MELHREKVQTHERCELLEVTDRVQELVSRAKMQSGLVVVYCPHTTAAMTINENADPDVKHDMLLKLSELIPKREAGYRHGEGNSDSHLKASLVGQSVTVFVESGELVLGRWQGIYFCEFDGPRDRQMYVKLIPDGQ